MTGNINSGLGFCLIGTTEQTLNICSNSSQAQISKRLHNTTARFTTFALSPHALFWSSSMPSKHDFSVVIIR